MGGGPPAFLPVQTSFKDCPQGYPEFLRFGPKILLAVVIPALDSVYNNIAVWLNDMGK